MRAADSGRAAPIHDGGGMKRRRFLAISAAALALPPVADAQSTSWQSQALGGQLRVDLRGQREVISGDYDVGIRFSVPIK